MTHTIDQLVYQANFATKQEQALAQSEIWQRAISQNIIPCSMAEIYLARGRGKIPPVFTVPAFNLRGLSYQTAQAAFKAAEKNQVGLFIFELARSEMAYTDQPPTVYASNILAAAIKTNWNRPVFIQGDHFQSKAKAPGKIKSGEIEALEKLIKQAIVAGFYNIDIDSSTLVDLFPPKEYEQQRANFETTSHLAQFVRHHQPTGITISIGGEIGEVGKHNSTEAELTAFMQGFQETYDSTLIGLSKIAIQTGTSHGGLVDSDGRAVMVNLDFRTLQLLSQLARQRYNMGGAVQHGASTLPIELFDRFPNCETLEIHLATGFQNFIFDHTNFPTSLKQSMYLWGKEHLQSEIKAGQTDQQFEYTMRKKLWGPFKKQLWQLEDSIMESIMDGLEKKFDTYFKKLKVTNTHDLVQQWVTPVIIEKSPDDYLPYVDQQHEDVSELSD